MTIPNADNNPADEVLADLIDEIIEKQRAGDPVDWDAYAAERPDCAEQLREMRSVVELLGQLSRVEGHGHPACDWPLAEAAAGIGSPDSLGILGDFRILREVGRGGMGVVYEAEQLSLHRRVALKVLPFAAVLDPRRLERFKNEACAGASLDHPNIIQVHSVGCEHGLHYYVMQYVEGPTMARVIAECRRLAGLDHAAETKDVAAEVQAGLLAPPFSFPKGSCGEETPVPPPGSTDARPGGRSVQTADEPSAALPREGPALNPDFFCSVATLGVQAADALEHAHRMGVVHRDIKPSNLLLADDGHLLVADFGLAMTATGADLTMTGDLLGTLRYMSPEQAQGNRLDLDHRTDIYSLGLTLYEMLTLRPAFGTGDPQQLLRQIAEEEPLPPRRLNSAIPADLETIVLKAIAKDPQARYATARELADDLTRFLESRPVHARRPSLPDRARRWLRRHPHAAWSGAPVLAMAAAVAAAAAWARLEAQGVSAVLLAVAAVIGWFWYRRRVLLIRAVEQRLGAARAFLKSGDHAAAGQQLAESQRWLDAAGFRQGPLPRAVAGLREKVRAKGRAEERFQRFEHLRRRVHSTMYHADGGIRKRAADGCRVALGFYGVLDGADWKGQPEYQDLSLAHRKTLEEAVAELLFVLARLQITDAGDPPARVPAHARALEALELIETCHRPIPAVRLWIAECRSVLGQGESAQAAARPSQAALTTALDHYVLGEFHCFQGQCQAAIESYCRALDREPDHCLSLLAAGMAWKKLGRPELAEGMFTAVLALDPQIDFAYLERGASRLAQRKPELAQLDFTKAGTTPALNGRRHLERAVLLQNRGDSAGALTLLDKAVAANPYASTAYLLRGRALMDAHRYGEAEADFTRAIDALGTLVRRSDPESPLSAGALGRSSAGQLVLAHHQRALARARLGRLDDALDDVEEASGPVPDGGSDVAHQQAWFLLTCPDIRLRDPQRAVALAKEAVDRSPDDGNAWNALGVAHYRAGDREAALQAIGESVKLRSGGDAYDWYVLALAYARLGKRWEARRWHRAAAQAAVAGHPQDELLRSLADEATELLGPCEPSRQDAPPRAYSRNGSAVTYRCRWCGTHWSPSRATCPRCRSPYFSVHRDTRPPSRGKRVLAALCAGMLLLALSCTSTLAAPYLTQWLDQGKHRKPAAKKHHTLVLAASDKQEKQDDTTTPAAVGGGGQEDEDKRVGLPEPSAAVLLLLGAAGLAGYHFHRRRNRHKLE